MSLAISKRVGTPEFHLEKIEQWLAPKLASEARPKATEACLCHHAMLPDGNTSDDIIDRVKITKDTKLEDLAEQLFHTAKASVDAHTRPQRYSVLLLETPDSPIGRREFLLTPPPSTSFGGETEPANATGLLGQHMRHVEAMQRLMIMAMQHSSSVLESQLERTCKENEKLRDMHVTMINAREDLLDRSAERNLKIRQQQADLDRGQWLVSRAEQLFGTVIESKLGLPQGALSGGTKQPGSLDGSPSPNPVKRLLGSLSEEQRAKLTESLDDILDEQQTKDFYESITSMKDE